MAGLPQFLISTQTDPYWEIPFYDADGNPLSVEGRTFEAWITPATSKQGVGEPASPLKVLTFQDGLSLLPPTDGSGDQTIKNTFVHQVSRAFAQANFPRGELTADILEVVGGARRLLVPVRLRYDDPAAIRDFVADRAGVTFGQGRQPIVTPAAIAGQPGRRGSGFLTGTLPPQPSDGEDGDYWIVDRGGQANIVYGPKEDGEWPSDPSSALGVGGVEDVPGLSQELNNRLRPTDDGSDLTVAAPVAGGAPLRLSNALQVTAKLLGAKGDASADDTLALRRINDAMRAGYTVRMEPGLYRTTDIVVFDAVRGSLEAQGAVIVPDANVLVPVQLGSLNRILSSRITGLIVDRGTFDPTRETEGFRLVNVSGVSLVDLEARYAKYNWRLRPGHGQLVSYLTLINPKAIYGRWNFWVDMGETGNGFATSITVLGGRFAGTVIGDPVNSNTDRNVKIDNKTGAVDMIRFFGTEMEGNQPYGIECHAPSNMFKGLRLEGIYSVAAIYFGPEAEYNSVEDMYDSVTVVDDGRYNRVEMARQTRLPGKLSVGTGRAPTMPLEAEENVNGLARFSLTNPNTGANRRADLKIGTGAGGNEAIFVGVDQAASAHKAFVDLRAGGPLAVQSFGSTTHLLGLDGSLRMTGPLSAGLPVSEPSLGGLHVAGNADGLVRHAVRNLSTGANRRAELALVTGPNIGVETLFFGVDQAASTFKGYFDNRSGGPFAFLSSGTAIGAYDTPGNLLWGQILRVVVDTNSNLLTQSYTVATLPTPGVPGRIAWASNGRAVTSAGALEAPGVGTGVLVTDNGAAWRIAGSNQTVSA